MPGQGPEMPPDALKQMGFEHLINEMVTTNPGEFAGLVDRAADPW